MAIFELQRNASVLINSVPHALKRKLDDGTWQLENEVTGRLIEHHEDALLEMLRAGELTYAPARASSSTDRSEVAGTRSGKGRSLWDTASDADKAYAHRALRYVKATLSAPAHRPLLVKTVARVAKESKDATCPSISTVYRWRSAYVVGGKDIAALLPRIKSRGNRTPRFGNGIREVLHEALDNHYLTRERPTLNDTLEWAVDRAAKNNKNMPEGDPGLPTPTLRMLRSVLGTYDPYEVCAARYGREYAQHKYHQSLGHCKAERGLDRVEFDHTPIDLMVIDDQTLLPLGRPYLTVALDVRHCTAQGYSLGFEPPSYLSVLRCLRHAIMPKTYVKKLYPSLTHTWLNHGVMASAGVDHAKEFRGKSLEDFAGRYGITLDFCPPGRPWFKGAVERFLGTINRAIAHGVPGSTFSSVLERADYDSAKTACITLSALHEMIHIWIVDYYQQRVHRRLGISPAASWAAEMTKRPIPLPTSAIELEQALAVPDHRTLTHKGIELDRLLYNSPALKPMLVRGGGSLPVEIRKSPEDLGHIYVLDAGSDTYIRVPVIDRFAAYAKGLSAWQHKVCLRYAQRHYQGRDDIVALSDAKQRIRDVVARALRAKNLASRKWASRYDQAGSPSVEVPPQAVFQDQDSCGVHGDIKAKATPSHRAGGHSKATSMDNKAHRSKAHHAPTPACVVRKLTVSYVQRRQP